MMNFNSIFVTCYWILIILCVKILGRKSKIRWWCQFFSCLLLRYWWVHLFIVLKTCCSESYNKVIVLVLEQYNINVCESPQKCFHCSMSPVSDTVWFMHMSIYHQYHHLHFSSHFPGGPELAVPVHLFWKRTFGRGFGTWNKNLSYRSERFKTSLVLRSNMSLPCDSVTLAKCTSIPEPAGCIQPYWHTAQIQQTDRWTNCRSTYHTCTYCTNNTQLDFLLGYGILATGGTFMLQLPIYWN